MKRFISIILSIVLVISLLPTTSVMAEADVTPPELESITVDKKEATVGDTVKVSVKASDNVGVQQVNLHYQKPITGNTIVLSMNYNESTKAFEGMIPITDESESGTYSIRYLRVKDPSGNELLLASYSGDQERLSGGEFVVSGTNGADITAPKLEGINVNISEATVGDTVKVSVKASDNVGVQQVNLHYQKPITGNTIVLSMNYNESTKAFEGMIPITDESESGTYSIRYLRVKDLSGNELLLASYSGDQERLSGGEFVVSGTSGADITAPKLENISVSHQKATYGDEVKISVKASDNRGIQQVNLHYQKPITGNTMVLTMNYSENTGAYEGMIPITDGSEIGTYSIRYLRVKDTSGNELLLASYSGDQEKLSGGEFSVITESNSPIFKSLSINNSKVEAGDSVSIDVNAKDDTNLNNATITYISPISKEESAFTLSYDHEKELLTGSVPVQKEMELGKWKVKSIEITDTNKNRLLVNSSDTDLSAGDFTVIKSVEPLDAYVISSNTTWSNTTINSDVYIAQNVTLSVRDNVTINGDVYTLGGFRSYGGLEINGSLITNSINFGYYTPSNGQAILSGSNSISSMVATNRILNDVPFKMYDTPLVSRDGKVKLTGATLPFVTVSVNGKSLEIRDNGTFKEEFFDVGGNDSLEVSVTDPFGYEYKKTFEVSEVYIDSITKDSKVITGKTLPDMKINLLSSGNELGSVQSDKEGRFELPVANLKENQVITLQVFDESNKLVVERTIKINDETPPPKPVVDEVTDRSEKVTGLTEPKATVFVKAGSKELGKTTASDSGDFSIPISAQKAGSKLTIFAVDAAGNQSESANAVILDRTAPEAPEVVFASETSISGKAEPGAKVVVSAGEVELGKTTSSSSGEFTVSIEQQVPGTNLSVVAIDEAGNQSEPQVVIVEDITAPEKPIVTKLDETSVAGTAETGSTVFVVTNKEVLGSGEVDASGAFNITFTKQAPGTIVEIYVVDSAGNESEVVTEEILDKTAPVQPSITLATEKSVKGTAEPLSEIQVTVGGKTFVTHASTKGDFYVEYNEQPVGSELKVVAFDKAGNKSKTATAIINSKTKRIAGKDRYQTAIEISKEAFKEGAETALLVRGDNFPDALAAAPLAYKLDGPILSTPKTKLLKETKDELKRLGVKKVIIIGGSGAVSKEVEAQLSDLGYNPDRISGKNRYETAAKIAERINSDKAVVAYGFNFADALAVAPFAARNGIPILLSDKDKLPESTKAALRKQTIVVGGTGVISDNVLNQLPTATRLSGKSRYDTNRAIVKHFDVKASRAFVATGRNYADALTGSVAAAKENAPLLLVEPTKLPDPISNLIKEYNYDQYSILGGKGVVSEEIGEVLK
ncbi:cell wall-binding repeat-containing protein [Alkalihalobacillus sp. CinArs1]|uniref:cell wall-binding repeat-containing protein n=1 Tax=Alkalihalobacillus sp. CinArs1 TaxID=2995314 RepID=UPI0022DD7CDB|nr:cell wall-binding repeat-containing protein [Alkalihalobacillus sp. CinArs1]